jgi:hypothetical protein
VWPILAAIVLAWGVRGGVAAQTNPPGSGTGCQLTMSSPLFVPLAATFGAVLIDDACKYVYLTNKTANRVEVFSLETLALETPIPVGLQPHGLDLTPDGRFLYVTNRGTISRINVAQRAVVQTIAIPNDFWGPRCGYSIAIPNNGLALMVLQSCETSGAEVWQLTLPSGPLVHRTDFSQSGSAPRRTHLRATRGRDLIAIAGGGSSDGSVRKYSSASNAFGTPRALHHFIADASTNLSGSTVLVTTGTYVLDGMFSLSGTILEGTLPAGSAIDPEWPIGYRNAQTNVEVLNLSTFLKAGDRPLGDTVTRTPGDDGGRLAISADGSLLAVIADHGFSLVRPWPTAPPSLNLVRNGAFGSGLTRWLTFATPDPTYLVGGVTGGVFEFARVPAPPGTSNQAVIYQETGMSLPAGAPLQADFDLGNSGPVRKRVSVLLLDSDFSDLHVCTFWLPPNLPLTPYRIRTHTTRPWVNASIYFYAATPDTDGFYRIDNVSLRSEPALPDDRTECVDPLAPLPPGGPDEADLLVNGDFASGNLAPWTTFGTITSQITGGVFEFIRPTSAPPAGVVLQATGQAMTAGQILTTTFALGNSSIVRKRVTVLLHDADFSDLAACTFWLPAGQPLSPYSMRMYATRAWANATISVYAATVGPDQWIQLDDVTLRRTPGAAITGTECHEPVTAIAPAPRPGGLTVRAASATRTDSTNPLAPRQPEPASRNPVVLPLADVLDLTGAAAAHLVFDSWLTSASAPGEIQVSLDGHSWVTHALVAPSGDWQFLDVDLGAWTGRVIAVRFVLHRPTTRSSDVWRIRHLRVAR